MKEQKYLKELDADDKNITGIIITGSGRGPDVFEVFCVAAVNCEHSIQSVTDEWKIWVIGEMIMTGENRGTGRETCHSDNFTTKNPTRTGSGMEIGPLL
jgi:hypothetical protein